MSEPLALTTKSRFAWPDFEVVPSGSLMFTNGSWRCPTSGKLFLSEKTIKHHMTNILQKLQVRNRVEAALMARGGELPNR